MDFRIFDVTEKPFVDISAPGNTRRSPTELTFIDKPSFIRDDKVRTQALVLDAFLVHGKEFMYHVRWKATTVKNDKGEIAGPINKIEAKESGKPMKVPPFALENELIYGYQPDPKQKDQYKVIKVPNPVK